MFRNPFKKDDETPLDALINMTLVRMSDTEPDTEEYKDLLTVLERLDKLKTAERPERISRDTIAVVVGNFLLGVLIVGYEQHHAMTSKALSLVTRPKVPATQ